MDHGDFQGQMDLFCRQIEDGLTVYLTEADPASEELAAAMRYSVLGGGKRVRGILVLAFASLFGIDSALALPGACAVELFHSYTLIHDDLPCMDDASLRRGKTACHLAFSETTALLAGDALLTLVFELLSTPTTLCKRIQLEAVLSMAKAGGHQGVVGGQMMDLAAEGKAIPFAQLAKLHRLKTGALIAASAELGAIYADAPAEEHQKSREFGKKLGLAFQIIDDILDCTATPEALGKPVLTDAFHEKTTYVSLFGLAEAKRLATTESEAALAILASLPGDTDFLRQLTGHLLGRDR